MSNSDRSSPEVNGTAPPYRILYSLASRPSRALPGATTLPTPLATSEVALSSGPLSYRVCGSGRPIVYFHPAGGVRWTPVLERLAESHTIYLPIAPGFDGTPGHANLNSVRDLGTLMADFIESTVGERCDVIGHSLGGWEALWLTVLRPELVDHAVVIAPDGLSPAQQRGFPSDLATLRELLFAHPERALPNEKSPEILAGNNAAAARYDVVGGVDIDLVARLEEIQTLTLILQGTEDRVCPTESVRRLRRKLQHAFLVYVWDAAHSPEVDQPERTFSIIDSFFTRSEAFMVNWGTLAVSRS